MDRRARTTSVLLASALALFGAALGGSGASGNSRPQSGIRASSPSPTGHRAGLPDAPAGAQRPSRPVATPTDVSAPPAATRATADESGSGSDSGTLTGTKGSGGGQATPVTVATATPLPAGSRTIGPLAPKTELTVDVALRPRDPAALSTYATAVTDPSSPDYHRYLPQGAVGGVFGATAASVAAVRAQLTADGLHVGPVAADDLSLPVEGTASRITAAFHTRIERVRLAGGRSAFANTTDATLTGAAASSVEGIVGLTDAALPRSLDVLTPSPHASPEGAPGAGSHAAPARPAPHATGPAPCAAAQTEAAENNGWTQNQLAEAYGLTSAYAAGDLGAGITIAVNELEPFANSDLAKFDACYKLAPKVVRVTVDGGAGSGYGSGEAALDVEDLVSLAPKATIDVYTAPDTLNGEIDDWRAIVDADAAKVVTTSWGECEGELAGSGYQAAENTLFEEAAVQGQSVLAAAGDDGAEDCLGSSGSMEPAVDDPAGQPWVTGVGGTDLTAIGPPPAETVWNEPNSGEGSGGGGVSATWPMPSYQSDAGISGTGREVPDLAASADPLNGYAIYLHGAWRSGGGTSAAAPTVAALVALLDESCGAPLGFLNPTLYSLGAAGAGDFNDITTGDNDYTGTNGGQYAAGPGYDMASGWGSPVGSVLLADACQSAAVSPSLSLGSYLAGATTSAAVDFTTSTLGTLASDGEVVLHAPAGTSFPSSAADYAVNGRPVASVTAIPLGTSTTANAVAVFPGEPVGASSAVSLAIAGITSRSTVGTTTMSLWTSGDRRPVPVPYVLTGPLSKATSKVTASVASVEADGAGTSTVTVKLADAAGRPVIGDTVTLTPASGNSTVSAISPVTGATGLATFSVSDTVAQRVVYDATDTTASVQLTSAVAVSFVVPTVSATVSQLQASTTSVPADGVTSATVTVTLEDVNGVPIAGRNVVLSQPAAGASGIQALAGTVTNSAGQVVFTITDATAQTVVYTARDTTDGVTLTHTSSVAFAAAAT